MIGSPAPQALRRGDRQHKLKKVLRITVQGVRGLILHLQNGSMSEFPTITLSACEDDEDDDDEEGLGVQRDAVMEVGEVCYYATDPDQRVFMYKYDYE